MTTKIYTSRFLAISDATTNNRKVLLREGGKGPLKIVDPKGGLTVEKAPKPKLVKKMGGAIMKKRGGTFKGTF
jgi:hypothetical protein|tara:strand:+ start:1750 stop:1968 length:219 start_codon:yes stop_codon:yes gene_type:complete